MQTESVSERFAEADGWSSLDLVEELVAGQFAAVAAVHAARQAIAETVERAADRLGQGGRLVYLGAGTSGRIAMQDAAELQPTFNWPPERALTLMAGGSDAVLAAIEGAEDDESEAPRRLDAIELDERDVVIGIAASGRTPFTVAGLAHARAKGALAVALHNNRNSRLGEVAEIDIILDTGAEFPAGSTRMKAGTAQKAALNAISTGVMVRLGYVYRGLMVEMRPSNAKLERRAAEIVARLTGRPPADAALTLGDADGSIKQAVLMLSRGVDRARAEAILNASDGDLRRAMAVE